MKILSAEELLRSDIDFDRLELSPASWTEMKTFFGYDTQPRPSSAFFIVCRDISAAFRQNDGVKVTARKGDILYIPEGMTYRAYFESGLEGNFADSYTMNIRFLIDGESVILSDRIKVLTRDQGERFELLFRELGESLHSEALGTEGKCYPIKIKAQVYAILFEMLNEAMSERETYYPIRKGVEAIAAEWNKNEKIEKYADACGISEGYFYRLFRERYGMSPVEYRNRIRLSHAETMLRNTEMSIGKIASFIGFDDPMYFCRVFKRHTGVSPKYFRKG